MAVRFLVPLASAGLVAAALLAVQSAPTPVAAQVAPSPGPSLAPSPSSSASPSAAPSPPAFGGKNATRHRAAVAPYRFESTVLRLRFDMARGTVYGHETVVVRPKQGPVSALPFDAEGMTFTRVLVDGKPATVAADAERQLVSVDLAAPAAPGARVTVDFTYTVQPQAGLYFVRPDAGYPHITPQIWTQGEPRDNHRWFPTWDQPNEKTPSELIVTVPRGWTVVGNGYLKAHTQTASLETWDWNAPRPKAPYLIAFVAGPLSKYHTTLGQVHDEDVARYGNAAMDVDSFVPPPFAAQNAQCLGRTNAIVAYFQNLIHARFPWEKYDQMAAERYIFGGMEDTSATILTTRALHAPSEEAEDACDELIAHELAQQWYGDDASWSDFSEVWLGEGFATYFDELWNGKRFGTARFEYERYLAQQAYFAETQAYLRPVIDDVYADPIQVFDSSSHERPAAILHSLRAMFGDARFFAALHTYYTAYAGRYASTHAFFASLGKSFGTDLGWFEEEWFHRVGVPHYIVHERYDAAARSLTLDVTQNNHDGRPFRMPVTIEAYAAGHVYRTRPVIASNVQTVVLRGVPSRPQMVLFDPDATILKELTFVQPVDRLAYQLAHATHVADREWALAQLGALVKAPAATRAIAMRAVRKATLGDPFYAVRADAAAVAAAFGDTATIEAALRDADRNVQLAAAAAAGTLPAASPAVLQQLDAMTSSADPNLVAAALQSLGALKAPGAYARLVAGLARPSPDDAIAAGAIGGLVAYGDPRALPLLRARTAYGTPEHERSVAIGAYARLAARAHRGADALPVLERIASADPLIASRLAATAALGTLGDRSALPTLNRVANDTSQKLVQLMAEDTMRAIEAAPPAVAR